MWLVRCAVCLDDKKHPRRWRETCKDCADDTAHKHRTDTGHLVEILDVAIAPEPRITRRRR